MRLHSRILASIHVMIAGFAVSVSSATREFGRAVYIIALDVFESASPPAPPLPAFSLIEYSAFSIPKVRAFLSRVFERLRVGHFYAARHI